MVGGEEGVGGREGGGEAPAEEEGGVWVDIPEIEGISGGVEGADRRE